MSGLSGILGEDAVWSNVTVKAARLYVYANVNQRATTNDVKLDDWVQVLNVDVRVVDGDEFYACSPVGPFTTTVYFRYVDRDAFTVNQEVPKCDS